MPEIPRFFSGKGRTKMDGIKNQLLAKAFRIPMPTKTNALFINFMLTQYSTYNI
jgi:hypothetical protein